MRRPLLRYHGGKFRLGPWIVANLPPHRTYVESYGGAASVLLCKPRADAEYYSDANPEVVNLVRRARDQGPELARLLAATTFCREEFEASWHPSPDPLEQARKTVVRSFMGHGADSVGGRWRTGFRGGRTDSTSPETEWLTYPAALLEMSKRLRGVEIECRDALDVIRSRDGSGVLHFVDPPYLADTRDRLRYLHEMTEAEHCALACALRATTGAVVLCGYPSELYEELFAGWHRVERSARGDKARATTEVLWIKA